MPWLRRRKTDSDSESVNTELTSLNPSEWSERPVIRAKQAKSLVGGDDRPQEITAEQSQSQSQSQPEPVSTGRRHDPMQETSSWSRTSIPPEVLVGSLSNASTAIEQMRATNPNIRTVVAYTQNSDQIDPTWNMVERPSDLVLVAMRYGHPAPVLVVDVSAGIEAWLSPLMNSLREAGVGQVRYVVSGSPSDKELAPWAEAIGWPSSLEIVPDPFSGLDPNQLGDHSRVEAALSRGLHAGQGSESHDELGK